MALSAAFEEPYGTEPGSGIIEPDDVTLMMQPPSPSNMRLATWVFIRKGPLKLRFNTESNNCSVTSWLGLAGLIPALQMRMSILPKAA